MLNWQAIDTVLLDMDGTLLDLHFDNHFWLEHLPRHYANLHGLSYDHARETIIQRTDQERGTLNWYCLDYWSQELGIDVAELKHEVDHLIRFHPHVEDFLAQLKATRHRVILVTNAHRKVLDLKLKRTILGQYLDRIISSHDFGCPKEDPTFWEHVQTIEAFEPERTVLIDDSLPVLRSAQQYGIRHLLCVVKPDSQKAAQNPEEFPPLESFRQIYPDEPSSHES